MKTNTKKLATLTKDEGEMYSNEFEYYLRAVRNDSGRADAYAWRCLVLSFPRLAEYEGAKP
jgi:hypothetical protein